jgi:hypothetical protein
MNGECNEKNEGKKGEYRRKESEVVVERSVGGEGRKWRKKEERRK